ncbi:hypothetical protein Tco_0728218 [Tanacetum coccineum]|uniref:Uncharacterized protein n=1 Tax=Tanacetum coccineum TaxID=301880 RepID=A0ABQ4YN44_9ASTR
MVNDSTKLLLNLKPAWLPCVSDHVIEYSFLKSDSRNFGVSPSRNHTEVLRTKALPYKPSDEEIQIRNVANNKFTGWVPSQLKNINLHSGPAPPPPPGQRQPNGNKRPFSGNSSDGGKKSGIGGAAIAGIMVSILVVGAIIAFFLLKKRSKKSPNDIEKTNNQTYQSADGHSKLRVTTVTRRWVETADVTKCLKKTRYAVSGKIDMAYWVGFLGVRDTFKSISDIIPNLLDLLYLRIVIFMDTAYVDSMDTPYWESVKHVFL